MEKTDLKERIEMLETKFSKLAQLLNIDEQALNAIVEKNTPPKEVNYEHCYKVAKRIIHKYNGNERVSSDVQKYLAHGVEKAFNIEYGTNWWNSCVQPYYDMFDKSIWSNNIERIIKWVEEYERQNNK